MNAAATEEVPEPAQEGPGERLRSIREAQGLDISRVAAELHLSAPVVQAIEADDYSGLPGSVFVQGYLRNYARLLSIPDEPILAAFQDLKPDNDRQLNLKAAQVRHELRSSHAGVRIITWLIVIGLVVLVLTWWRGYLKWPMSENGMESAQEPIQESAEPEFDAQQTPILVPFAPQAESSVTETEDAAQIQPQIEEVVGAGPAEQAVEQAETEMEEVIQTQSEAQPQPESTIAVTDTASQEAPEESAVAEAVVEEAPVAAAPSRKAVVEFLDDCWVDIRDASGQFKLVGLQKKGGSSVLAGEAPYKMVLGNAASVRVMVNGEDYDFTPHTRGNVARFTFDPASSR
ncbi:RodZ domain-containing protein [Solemya velesiana gill symbiont]|uniref:Cytoskeleton protein RodZ-like C-terminal domain-containing protein n=1 Tax=Solemya velesiana gill symbiont TaxID=1918948 RepID=A0A1T2KRZ9_9GAMM|nr:RodZ family helix-turn-helix domain-containing protein [Solemya velesiana gill symbiont]OOZ35633.1 hypothetical protein BOW51_11100 [Solemya velesiana gill symbiont]